MAKVPTMTYELAMAAGHDAGNRSMRAAGRKQWDGDDWNAACAEFERLWPGPTAKSSDLSRQEPPQVAKGSGSRLRG